MALLKIYTMPENKSFLREELGYKIKLIFSAALNCTEIPTSPSNIELVYSEGVDLADIDFIIEIVACARPSIQDISDSIITNLNNIYPDKLFSVYFNLIQEEGMANSPRASKSDRPITMGEALELAKR